jgi:hypothetical protein
MNFNKKQHESFTILAVYENPRKIIHKGGTRIKNKICFIVLHFALQLRSGLFNLNN